MNEITRKEIAKEFKKAKDHLAKNNSSGKTNYICYALYYSNNKVTDKCVSIILSRIRPYSYADSWAEANGYKPKNNDYQKWRHAWLDKLIEEFSHD